MKPATAEVLAYMARTGVGARQAAADLRPADMTDADFRSWLAALKRSSARAAKRAAAGQVAGQPRKGAGRVARSLRGPDMSSCSPLEFHRHMLLQLDLDVRAARAVGHTAAMQQLIRLQLDVRRQCDALQEAADARANRREALKDPRELARRIGDLVPALRALDRAN